MKEIHLLLQHLLEGQGGQLGLSPEMEALANTIFALSLYRASTVGA